MQVGLLDFRLTLRNKENQKIVLFDLAIMEEGLKIQNIMMSDNLESRLEGMMIREEYLGPVVFSLDEEL